jgi:phage head maturation protease
MKKVENKYINITDYEILNTKELGDNSVDVTFKLTVEKFDRSNEKVMISGIKLDNYLKNPVVLYEHSSAVTALGTGIIGTAKNLRVEGDSLVASINFHMESQLSKELSALVSKNIIKAVSIGFIPLEIEYIPLTSEERKSGNFYPGTTKGIIKSSELIEFSLVSVPANPYAIRKNLKINMKDIREKSGAVLNKTNRSLIETSISNLKSVLSNATSSEKSLDIKEIDISILQSYLDNLDALMLLLEAEEIDTETLGTMILTIKDETANLIDLILAETTITEESETIEENSIDDVDEKSVKFNEDIKSDILKTILK